ncbi:hypothetical protein E2C01_050033 [Portunus trituberculatus]|uniref:Uncharacterized protein n=1 Tax=Portunus trituberculatus TaxID=210409 RepID=A0A5B7G7W8_PORTR|nr:hypothetical protein [Portunus trituberculatus]
MEVSEGREGIEEGVERGESNMEPNALPQSVPKHHYLASPQPGMWASGANDRPSLEKKSIKR